MKIKYLLIVFLLSLNFSFAQKSFTISGYVTDKSTGEKLISATIYDFNTKQGTLTNEYGFYSFTLKTQDVKLRVSYVGYKTIEKDINLTENIVLNFDLASTIELSEVVVIASKKEDIVKSTQMGTVEVPIQKIKSLPVFLGEKDIIKTIQLLPGVQSGSEGSSGLYVRGGGPDQNLILLDGVPVYNADHLFGFFSVFNPDAIKNVTLIKGGYPARYGGRLSSVIDVRMKEGNNQKFAGEASIGIIASKFTFEGPIIKNKTSFIVSARRTYVDALALPIIKAIGSSNGIKLSAGYYFYDVNLKINHKFSERSHLYLSSYLGDDRLYLKTKSGYTFNNIYNEEIINTKMGWGNLTSALRWNYKINDKLFSNSTLTYSRYKFYVGTGMIYNQTFNNVTTSNEVKVQYDSGIDDIASKIDFDYIPNPNHYIRFGIGNTYHKFNPGITYLKYMSEIDSTLKDDNILANEMYSYIEDDITINSRLKANLGIHLSGFYVNDKFYKSIQPRFSTRFMVNETWSIKAAFTKMDQYVHLLTSSKISMPTDLWLPVTDKILPQSSYQYALGTFHKINQKFDLSFEAFYKTMNNLLEYKEGAGLFSHATGWEDKVETGKGWAYGAEILFEKNVGKTTGWLGYTLSWSERQFDNLNFGEIFPYRYDRRHDIGLAITHKFNDHIDVGLVWVFGTGNAVSLAVERYMGNQYHDPNYDYFYYDDVEYYKSRNDFRMPSYHRLDLGINFHKKIRKGDRTLSVGVYNVYNRKNPFFLNFENNNQGHRVLVQYSLFPFMPSIYYSIKFGKMSKDLNIE